MVAELVSGFARLEPFLFKDQLIALVKEPLNKLNLDIKIKITVMNQKELQNFLNKEQKNWIG